MKNDTTTFVTVDGSKAIIADTAPSNLVGWDYVLYDHGEKWSIRITRMNKPIGCSHYGSEKYIKKLWKQYKD